MLLLQLRSVQRFHIAAAVLQPPLGVSQKQNVGHVNDSLWKTY